MLLRAERLVGVHPDLVKVVELGAGNCPFDVIVLEGVRSKERHAQLLKSGASRTKNTRHFPQEGGLACAVDLAPVLDTDGDGDKEPSWHWPHYDVLARFIKSAASNLKVPVDWGGDWKTFKDGPHWELPRRIYP